MARRSTKSVAFQLFCRDGSASSEAALAALNQYCEHHVISGFVLEYINRPGWQQHAHSSRIVVVPALAVKVGGFTELLVNGLAPYATLKKTLDGLVPEGANESLCRGASRPS
jgi:hypothetical protein